MAGANISGEVKKPGYSIPWGTLLAIAVSSCVYLLLGVLLASAVEREVWDINGQYFFNREDCTCFI